MYERYLSTINWGKIISEKKNFTLLDGDSINIKPILDLVLNQVTISGSVNQPGSYSISAYPDLKSLIQFAAKGTQPRTNKEKVDVFHTDINGKRTFESLSLEGVLVGDQNLNLSQNDSVYVYSESRVSGEEPWIGYYSFMKDTTQVGDSIRINWSENISLFDVIFSLNPVSDPNFIRQALFSRVDVNRYNSKTGMYTVMPFNLKDVIERKDSTLLMPFDQVRLYSKEVYAKRELGEEYSIYDRASQVSSTCLALNDDLVHLTAMKNIENRYAR